MSSKWVQQGGVMLGGFCSTQGAVKNAGNLAVSLWTLTLATHTFLVLFLRWKIRDYALYVTLFGVWLLVGFLVVLGPAAIQSPDKGPYFGISGFWCWIADPYPASRIAMEYFWLLGSAGLSFVFYSLTFLRLRGNLVIEKGKVRLLRVDSENSWKYLIGRDSTDIQMTQVAKGMLGFPILFTVTILPIAICRFIAWSGGKVSMQATIFADAVFSLTGVFDLVLFMATKSLLPEDGFMWWISPRPHVSAAAATEKAGHGLEYGTQPYPVQDFASARGFSEMYQREAERDMRTLSPRTSASLGMGMNDQPKPSGATETPSRPSGRPATLSFSSSLGGSPVPGTNVPDQGMNVHVETGNDNDNDNSLPLPPSPAAEWDDIDLARRVSPARNEFSDPAPLQAQRRSGRDTARYTTFSLSAYEYGEEDVLARPGPAHFDPNAKNDPLRGRL
ncbi:hypothetical protein BU17DRAFT_84426 [Hysterangium stoloniferum]|nr:hypothetical protein BU17DRAFT_84426 [Hysterangium stoloniferum]